MHGSDRLLLRLRLLRWRDFARGCFGRSYRSRIGFGVSLVVVCVAALGSLWRQRPWLASLIDHQADAACIVAGACLLLKGVGFGRYAAGSARRDLAAPWLAILPWSDRQRKRALRLSFAPPLGLEIIQALIVSLLAGALIRPGAIPLVCLAGVGLSGVGFVCGATIAPVRWRGARRLAGVTGGPSAGPASAELASTRLARTRLARTGLAFKGTASEGPAFKRLTFRRLVFGRLGFGRLAFGRLASIGLARVDRGRPRWLGVWAMEGRGRWVMRLWAGLLGSVGVLGVAGSLATGTPAPGVLAAVVGGHLVFLVALRARPLRADALRLLPVSFRRAAWGVVRLPLLLSLGWTVLPVASAFAAAPGDPAPVGGVFGVLVLDGLACVSSLWLADAPAAAMLLYGAIVVLGVQYWARLGISELAVLIGLVGLLWRGAWRRFVEGSHRRVRRSA